MKITIDTTEKTAIVHGDASFNEIEAILKAVDPERWAIYRLTCQNVSFSTFVGGQGSCTTIKGSNMLTFTNGSGSAATANTGWYGEELPKNVCRDLTYKPN